MGILCCRQVEALAGVVAAIAIISVEAMEGGCAGDDSDPKDPGTAKGAGPLLPDQPFILVGGSAHRIDPLLLPVQHF